MFFLIALSFVVSFVLTGLFRQWAVRNAVLDFPNERSSHTLPVPRGGGIVFAAIFYAALIFLWHIAFLSTDLLLALLGSLPIAVVGFLDDMYSIAAQWRLITQCMAAIWSLYYLHLLSHPTSPLLLIITLWFTNLYNFMDGIDGLAASEAVFIALTTGILLFIHHATLSVPLLVLAAAVLGFLCWNWQPAKVFMGDAGSGFLGFTFAIFMWASASQGVLPVIFWWVLLMIFLCDATFTLLRRMIQKKKWYTAHREHLYQQMAQAGFRHSQIIKYVMSINMIVLLPIALLALHFFHGMIL